MDETLGIDVDVDAVTAAGGIVVDVILDNPAELKTEEEDGRTVVVPAITVEVGSFS